MYDIGDQHDERSRGRLVRAMISAGELASNGNAVDIRDRHVDYIIVGSITLLPR